MRSLTDVHHIYVHGVGESAAQCVGGHHSDVVVDPDGCVVLVKEAGVLSSCTVVRTLVHCLRATKEAEEQHVIACVSYVTFPKNSMHSSCFGGGDKMR